MKLTVALVVVTLSAVLIGIFNRRWAIACTMVVLHLAIGGFIFGCMSHWATERRQMASPSGSYALGNAGGMRFTL